jgi:hypothetical protein
MTGEAVLIAGLAIGRWEEADEQEKTREEERKEPLRDQDLARPAGALHGDAVESLSQGVLSFRPREPPGYLPGIG